jgi:hypothetical protein
MSGDSGTDTTTTAVCRHGADAIRRVPLRACATAVMCAVATIGATAGLARAETPSGTTDQAHGPTQYGLDEQYGGLVPHDVAMQPARRFFTR